MIAEPVTNTNFISKLSALKQERFSGQLFLKDSLGQEWTFYLFLGRILYATGGVHPVRRWRRNLNIHCPQVDIQQLKLSSAISNISWEYQLLYTGVEQQQINREQAAKIIGAIIAEVSFDVNQAREVTSQVKPEDLSVPQLVLVDPEQVITEVQQVWQNWQKAKITPLSPNQAPVIKQLQQLQEQVSPAVYQNLTKLLDGQRTLRDLAGGMKRDVVEVIFSLMPYIRSGVVELAEIADVAAPIVAPPPPVTPPPTAAPQRLLIACVDDSPMVCQSMEKILTTGGYQFLAVQDSLRAIATLLTRKPALIFLDLVMPNTNGYEICGQLRKISTFRDTPIIILTGNDGIIDRVRAKMVGATDFLSKPVNAEIVLDVARQYLNNRSLVE
jgi:chemotaxis family two-component system response regulator PixG